MVTQLQAEVTKTATFNGSAVDISAIAAPLSIEITVDALTAGSTAIFELQTSTDSTPFSSDIRVEKTFSFFGPLSNIAPETQVVQAYDLPGFRNGVSQAHARIALAYIDGSSSVSYSANLQN